MPAHPQQWRAHLLTVSLLLIPLESIPAGCLLLIEPGEKQGLQRRESPLPQVGVLIGLISVGDHSSLASRQPVRPNCEERAPQQSPFLQTGCSLSFHLHPPRQETVFHFSGVSCDIFSAFCTFAVRAEKCLLCAHKFFF